MIETQTWKLILIYQFLRGSPWCTEGGPPKVHLRETVFTFPQIEFVRATLTVRILDSKNNGVIKNGVIKNGHGGDTARGLP